MLSVLTAHAAWLMQRNYLSTTLRTTPKLLTFDISSQDVASEPFWNFPLFLLWNDSDNCKPSNWEIVVSIHHDYSLMDFHVYPWMLLWMQDNVSNSNFLRYFRRGGNIPDVGDTNWLICHDSHNCKPRIAPRTFAPQWQTKFFVTESRDQQLSLKLLNILSPCQKMYMLVTAIAA